MKKVCYFTSKNAHDTRIYEKECLSLAAAGYEVFLVSPNSVNEFKNGINFIGFDYEKKGIFYRLFLLPKLLFNKALNVNADIYHFNDPASLYFGLKLKRKGKKVIFDSFEDHPALIFEKKFIPYFIKFILSRIYSVYEFHVCKKFDGVITCYHWTQDRLGKACNNSQLVFNFPRLEKILIDSKINNCKTICYAGLISPMWCLENILTSMSQLDDTNIIIAGNPADTSYLRRLKNTKGWERVNYLGRLEHADVFDKVYSQSIIGMVLLDYIPLCKGNIGNLSNNKLFEYMKAGLPVICTDFILWKEIIDKYECGICVNPHNVDEIVTAIKFLTQNPDLAKRMGQNGQKAILDVYNWNNEEQKLLNIYRNLF